MRNVFIRLAITAIAFIALALALSSCTKSTEKDLSTETPIDTSNVYMLESVTFSGYSFEDGYGVTIYSNGEEIYNDEYIGTSAIYTYLNVPSEKNITIYLTYNDGFSSIADEYTMNLDTIVSGQPLYHEFGRVCWLYFE